MPNYFCANLAADLDGLFCIAKALEGQTECSCPFGPGDCHVVRLDPCMVGGRIVSGKLKIQCGGRKTGSPTLVGVCQDFEASSWLKYHLRYEPLEYTI